MDTAHSCQNVFPKETEDIMAENGEVVPAFFAGNNNMLMGLISSTTGRPQPLDRATSTP